jgi:hyperosmotically inducible protein
MKILPTCLLTLAAVLATPLLAPVAHADRTAGQTIDDATLVTSTKTALAGVAANVASAINVDVSNGRVLLAGFVDSKAQKDAALAAARKVEGHTKIVDGLVVMPGTRSLGKTIDDQTIQTEVKAALLKAEGMSKGSGINTECKNGEILLSGWVPSAKYRDVAGKAAAGVKGVTKVHNFVEVR